MCVNNGFFSVLALVELIVLIVCCNVVVFIWFWNGNDCDMFTKMWFCVSVEKILYMFVRYLITSGSRCFRCLMFMPYPVELLFVITNCTLVVVSSILLVGRFLVLWSMCVLILFVLYGMMFVNCLLKAFTLSMLVLAVLFESNASALLCRWFFVQYFCYNAPKGSVYSACDQFYQDVVSKCWF